VTGTKKLPKVSGLVKGEHRSGVPLGVFARKSNEARPELRTVPIDLMDDSPKQNRLVYDEVSLLELGRTLLRHQVEPVVLWAKKGGRYEIQAGHRRKRACALVGKPDLMALVYPSDADVTSDEMAYDLLISNEQREDLGDFERALGYRQTKMELGLSQSELASALGVSEALISRRLAYFKLPDSVQAALMKVPRAFSHRFVTDFLDLLRASPQLETDLVQGIVEIGANEVGPEALLRRLQGKKAGIRGAAAASGVRRIQDDGGRDICSVRRSGGKQVVISVAKGVDADEFAAKLADLIKASGQRLLDADGTMRQSTSSPD